VLVLSDYAKGWLSSGMCRTLLYAAEKNGIASVVDPKARDWERYRGATVICPSEKEYSPQQWAITGPRAHWIVEKRGARGMVVIPPNLTADIVEIPAHARHVFDVTGAGDTVTAVIGAALGAGARMVEAAHLAAYAAAYVVGEVGTSVCSLAQLRAQLGGSDHVEVSTPARGESYGGT